MESHSKLPTNENIKISQNQEVAFADLHPGKKYAKIEVDLIDAKSLQNTAPHQIMRLFLTAVYPLSSVWDFKEKERFKVLLENFASGRRDSIGYFRKNALISSTPMHISFKTEKELIIDIFDIVLERVKELAKTTQCQGCLQKIRGLNHRK